MNDHRPPLYLITGIVVGVLVGLLIAYVLLPVKYTDTTPATLSSAQKDIYRQLVGRVYLYEGDSGRALSRLALLQESNENALLVAQSQQMLANGDDAEAAQGLGLLAVGQVITPLAIPTTVVSDTATATSTSADPTETVTPTLTATAAPTTTETVISVTSTPVVATTTPDAPSDTPFATFTPWPSATSKPTQGVPYALVDQKTVCDSKNTSPLLVVEVYDASGAGVAGVTIEISLPNGGSTTFYTGLYPEIDDGYADYTMNAGDTYSLRVGVGGTPVSGVTSPQCKATDGSTYAGSLQLTFKQP